MTWQGTLFNLCMSDRIFLRHSQFNSGSTVSRTCNNGTEIIGYTIGACDKQFIHFSANYYNNQPHFKLQDSLVLP